MCIRDRLDAGLNVLGDTTAYRYNYLSAGQVNQLLSFLHNLENLGLDVSLGQMCIRDRCSFAHRSGAAVRV